MEIIHVALTSDHAPAYSKFPHGTIHGESITGTYQFLVYIYSCDGETKA